MALAARNFGTAKPEDLQLKPGRPAARPALAKPEDEKQPARSWKAGRLSRRSGRGPNSISGASALPRCTPACQLGRVEEVGEPARLSCRCSSSAGIAILPYAHGHFAGYSSQLAKPRA